MQSWKIILVDSASELGKDIVSQIDTVHIHFGDGQNAKVGLFKCC